jgi:tetratricopeptide (TPR) repeat protein
VRTATGDYQGAAQVLEQALEISHDIGYRICQVTVLIGLGTVRRATGDNPGAAQVLERAVVISREIGDPGAEAEILNETATLYHASPAGPQNYREAPTLSRAIGSHWDEAHALAGLGRCALAHGRTSDATENLKQALDILRKIGAAEITAEITAELDSLTQPRQDPPGLELTDLAGTAAAD